MREKQKNIDKGLFISVFILIVLGLFFITTISFPLGLEKFSDGYYFLKHQIIWGILPGIFLGYFVFITPWEFFRKFSFYLFFLNIFFLILLFFPMFGGKYLGASRWFSFKGISFQPSEFLKLTSIFYFVSLIDKYLPERKNLSLKTKKINQRTLFFLMLFILCLISIILILQPDASTLIIIALTLILIYFCDKRTSFFYSFILLILVMIGVILLFFSAPYRFKRFIVFLNPEIDPLGAGYQLRQSLIAIGSGGITGRGLGESGQKFGFLPQTISDSIFAIYGEETGFFGCLFLLFLYFLFLQRGIDISRKTSNSFCKMVGLGITFFVVLQAFVHIAGLLGIGPLSGSPLSFISYGGSHLIVEIMGWAFLLNISKNQKI